jgi:hypothetical protein
VLHRDVSSAGSVDDLRRDCALCQRQSMPA